MLTAELVRVQVRQGTVRPRFVDAAEPELVGAARELLEIFSDHVGRRVGDLEEAVADHIGDGTDFYVWRGLTKLLMDRAEVKAVSARPPGEIREAVFKASALAWPVAPAGVGPKAGLGSRGAVIAQVAAELGISAEAVESGLYADLSSEERLVSVDLPEPRALLDRYNLGLAQAVLLKAREVVIELPGVKPARARQLFRIAKFHRLMHRAEKVGKGWRVTLDGPLSLFRHTQRYGLQMALFLPALCHCPKWSLRAEVAWGADRRPLTMTLDQDTGLVTHTRDLGTWESEEERHLRKSWKKSKTEWKLRRATEVVDLDGRGVLVPDYVLRHPDGRKAYLDIVWFWRKRSFEGRMALLREAGPPNLVVAVATRLRADEDAAPKLPTGAVYPFKGVLRPQRIAELADEVAV